MTDTTDDILAKYRKVAPSLKAGDGAQLSIVSKACPEEEDAPPAYDPHNLETCKAFIDVKKKLRLVLSNADFQVISLTY